MGNPAKILALFLFAALLVSGCARLITVEPVKEEAPYTEIGNLSDLGIEGTDNNAADETSGSSHAEDVADTSAEGDSEPVPVTSSGEKVTVREGQLIELKPKAVDPDGDEVTYTFSPPLDEEGKWQTKKGDKGIYKVQVTAKAGASIETKNIEITVKEENKAPVLSAIEDIAAKVGDTVELSPEASDANDDKLTFSYSGWMASSKKTADESDVGENKVTVTVSDGELTDSQEVIVRVEPLNTAPVMEKISDITVKEGGTVSFDPKVIDPDGDEVTVTYSGWMASSSKKTGFDDAGTYSVKITASDGKLETSQNVKVTVEDIDRGIEGFEVEFVIS